MALGASRGEVGADGGASLRMSLSAAAFAYIHAASPIGGEEESDEQETCVSQTVAGLLIRSFIDARRGVTPSLKFVGFTAAA